MEVSLLHRRGVHMIAAVILLMTCQDCLAQTISGAFCWGGGNASLTVNNSPVLVPVGSPVTISVIGGCGLQSNTNHVATVTTTDSGALVGASYTLSGSDYSAVDVGGIRYWNFSHTFGNVVTFQTPGPQTLSISITGVEGGVPRTAAVLVLAPPIAVPAISSTAAFLLMASIGAAAWLLPWRSTLRKGPF